MTPRSGTKSRVDRISDIFCDIVKAKFIEYTQTVSTRHKLMLQEVPVRLSCPRGSSVFRPDTHRVTPCRYGSAKNLAYYGW